VAVELGPGLFAAGRGGAGAAQCEDLAVGDGELLLQLADADPKLSFTIAVFVEAARSTATTPNSPEVCSGGAAGSAQVHCARAAPRCVVAGLDCDTGSR
jgi:hypothetical protein